MMNAPCEEKLSGEQLMFDMRDSWYKNSEKLFLKDIEYQQLNFNEYFGLEKEGIEK